MATNDEVNDAKIRTLNAATTLLEALTKVATLAGAAAINAQTGGRS